MLHGRLDLNNARYEACTFDNCSANGGVARRVEVVNCMVWSCGLRDVILEDCVLQNLRMSYPGGGKRMPLILDGVMTRRVIIRGTIGSFIWNPPDSGSAWATPAAVEAAQRFYATVDDWALDVSDARFRSVPSLRFGPPGALVRRDPDVQPLITRARANAVLGADPVDLGVWGVVLESFVRSPWPDEIVMIPGLGGRRESYEEDLAGLNRLRGVGAFDE